MNEINDVNGINDVKEQNADQSGENHNGNSHNGDSQNGSQPNVTNRRGLVNGMPAAIATRMVPLAPTPVSPPGIVRTLDEARGKAESVSQGQWDAVIPRHELAFHDGQLVFCDGQGMERRLSPNTWATGQLCARLGIPATYFHKCPPELQDAQVNYWLANPNGGHPMRTTSQEMRYRGTNTAVNNTAGANTSGDSTQWLLRANGETLRAVLSERYSPLDNPQLLDCLKPLWQKQYSLDWFALSDESLHLRIVDPMRTRTVRRGDGLTIGVHIANSEVGLRAVTVDALVYRLVCSNGLIRLVKGKSLLRQRHIHITGPRFVAALEEAVDCAWDEAEGFLDRLKLTTGIPVPEVEQTIEGIAQRWQLSEAVQSDVLASLRREPTYYQETLYGVVNAFTNAAQRLPSEGRYDLEVLAGHLAEHGVNGYSGGSGGGFGGSGRTKIASNGTTRPDRSEHPRQPVRQSVDNESLDVVEAAREMFEAQIVTRQPRPQSFRPNNLRSQSAQNGVSKA